MLIGGRTSPTEPLNDVWMLHLPTMTWSPISTTTLAPAPAPGLGAAAAGASTTTLDPSPAAARVAAAEGAGRGAGAGGAGGGGGAHEWPGRYRHSAAADPVLLTPYHPPCAAPVPGPLAAHPPDSSSGSRSAYSVVVYGGRDAQGVRGDLWVLRVPAKGAATAGAVPAPAADAVPAAAAAPVGGCCSSPGDPDPDQTWTWVGIPEPGHQHAHACAPSMLGGLDAAGSMQHKGCVPGGSRWDPPRASPQGPPCSDAAAPHGHVRAAAGAAGAYHTITTIAPQATATVPSSPLLPYKPAARALAVAWPPRLKSHAAAVLHGRMYLHGGTAEYGGQSAAMFCLDLQVRNCWARLQCLAPARSSK